MRTLAILISPLGIVLIEWIIYDIFYQRTESWFLIIEIVVTYFIALLAQIVVEFILFIMEFWIETTLKVYIQLAFSISGLLSLITLFIFFYENNIFKSIEMALDIFLFFSIYSIGNALTYNYLYFTKVHKQ